jgi:dGTPase
MSDQFSRFAVTEDISKGRIFPEKPHLYRSDFERDRDRIIHCSAFRRLEGKTQVFTTGLDDYYRTRLTHSIEVAQIGRTIAKLLGLNESLTEAIALAHDLGHPPFGHSGEKVLNELMSSYGGFEHNRQSLRIVDLLEHPYPDFMGLNLMYESRLGLARHSSPYDKSKDIVFGEINCSLEGQIVNLADRIAYNCHDLEDGMRAGLIDSRQIKNINIVTQAQAKINADAISDRTIYRTRTAKAIIDMLVSDCIQASTVKINGSNIKSLEDIYACSEYMIILSEDSHKNLCELEDFLMQNFYLHKQLMRTAKNVKKRLEILFDKLIQQPQLMPTYFRRFIEKEGLQRTVCDYIAGMTDRFCLKILKEI